MLCRFEGAFDRVDRKILRERMREMGVLNKLKEKTMETYKETKNVVKVGERWTEDFWTKGVRQGCPMSPTLFNIYVTDLEEEMRKGQLGGVVVGRRKIWTLMYADDIASATSRKRRRVERNAEKIQEISREERLILSPEKTKVMVFEKGRGRVTKRIWKWGEEKLEEVKEI